MTNSSIHDEASSGAAEREGLTGGGCDQKYKNVLHCKSRSSVSIEWWSCSGQLVQQLRKLVRRHRETGGDAHMARGAFTKIFTPQRKSLKVKENVSGQILVQMRGPQMLAEFKKSKKRRAKFAPGRR